MPDVGLLIGTASWADKPLIESGKFYPSEAKSAEARLRFYAGQVPLVEADGSVRSQGSGTDGTWRFSGAGWGPTPSASPGSGTASAG